MLSEISNKYQIKASYVTIACNGLSVLKQAQKTAPPESTCQHYDLIGAFYQIQQSLLLELKFKHVKGHQDGGLPTVLLRTAHMNIECNTQAKEKATTFQEGLTKYKLPYEGWCCYIQDKKVMKILTEELQAQINGLPTISHWNKKSRFGKGTSDLVNWDALTQTMKSMPMAQQ